MSKQLAESPQTPPATAITSALGLENVENEDLVLPHIILVNAKSYYSDDLEMKPGTYANSLSHKETTGEFVPFYAHKYYDLLVPKGDGMEYDRRVFVKPEGDTWQFFNKKDDAGRTISKANVDSVLSILAVVDGLPAIINFSKSNYKAGKTLLSIAKFAGGPFWLKKYSLVARKVTKNGNTYFVSEVNEVGPTTDEEQKAAAEYYGVFAKRAKGISEAQGAKDDLPA